MQTLTMALDKRPTDSGFWSGGEEAYASAILPRITEEVTDEFATRLEVAGPVRRFFLRRQMDREIEKRIRQKLPPDAHY